jgi:hypothetical protein
MSISTVTHPPTAEPTGTREPSSIGRRWPGRLFGAAVVVTGIIGLVFAQSMHPTAGPYAMNERYPFGDAERTWQVTVGFDWIAYAILFAVAGVAVRRVGGGRLWALMGLSFAILWFPHLAIGVAMALDGS